MNRDTQFAGFARLLYEEFANSGKTYRDGTVTRGELSREEAEQIIARRAYDLVRHAIYCNGMHPDLWPGAERYGQASDIYLREVAKHADAIPDMRRWPQETKHE